MDSATKTVGGVGIAWMALTFNVARPRHVVCRRAEEMPIQVCCLPHPRELTLSEHVFWRNWLAG